MLDLSQPLKNTWHIRMIRVKVRGMYIMIRCWRLVSTTEEHGIVYIGKKSYIITAGWESWVDNVALKIEDWVQRMQQMMNSLNFTLPLLKTSELQFWFPIPEQDLGLAMAVGQSGPLIIRMIVLIERRNDNIFLANTSMRELKTGWGKDWSQKWGN